MGQERTRLFGGSVFVYARFCAVGYGDSHTRRNVRTRQKKPQGNARASAARIYAGVLWLCLPVPRRSLALLLRLSVPSTAIAAGALPAQYKKLSLFQYKNGGRLLRPTPISKVKKLISYLTYMKHGDMMQMGILPKYEKGARENGKYKKHLHHHQRKRPQEY